MRSRAKYLKASFFLPSKLQINVAALQQLVRRPRVSVPH